MHCALCLVGLLVKGFSLFWLVLDEGRIDGGIPACLRSIGRIFFFRDITNNSRIK